MNKTDRVKAALRGAVVDRPPYGFWTHMPGIDLEPGRIAAETAAFAARYDIDFVKSMPNGFYCTEDWGCTVDYSDIAHGGVAKIARAGVAVAEDWSRIEALDVGRGAFGRELEHLALLMTHVGPRVPVLATVFSPFTAAAKISNGVLREHLAAGCDRVAPALDAITATTCEFVRRAIGLGCAGIFLAIQEATRAEFTESAYREHAEPHDRRVLSVAREAGGWFNAVHMHGNDVLFDLLAQYEADALNWHIGETPPSIRAYREAGGRRPILGGIKRGDITQGDVGAVRRAIEQAAADTEGRGLLLAPACVIRHPVDDAVLRRIADAVKAMAR